MFEFILKKMMKKYISSEILEKFIKVFMEHYKINRNTTIDHLIDNLKLLKD